MPKKKRRKKSDKGGPFERAVCEKLDRWWTGNDEESVFWRTSQSGGRGTTRRKKGRKTAGQYGDISSTDPSSKAFTRLFTIELKRGYKSYSGSTVADVLDRHKKLKSKSNQTTFEEFIEQVWTAQKNAGTPFWMLIQRRDYRDDIVFFPHELLPEVRELNFVIPSLRLTAKLRLSSGKVKTRNIVGMRLDDFLSTVSPKDIKRVWKDYKS